MKVRNDSPFIKLTDEQQQTLLEVAGSMTVAELVELAKEAPLSIHCSIPAMRRFLQRLREHTVITETQESAENVQALAKQGEVSTVREATLTTARQRMFESMLETNNRPAMLEMFTALNEEKEQERRFLLEERKVKVAEDHAKLGWKKLEHDRAVSAAKLLPKVWAILTDVRIDPQERAARAQQFLAREGGRLLPEIPVQALTEIAEAKGEALGSD